ncbi:MAG TPA: hypothetical protein VLV78_06080 [Thermoanaerobaculia bacterium]|nr:hypothetical protein [Thermoanaerobaculia bacterium]
MVRPKIGFLPAFFTVLIAGFSIALFLRIRSYRQEARRAPLEMSTGVVQTGGSGPGMPGVVVTTIPDASAPATPEVSGERRSARRRQPLTDLVPPPTTTTRPAARTATQAPPPPKPSLLSRIVTPIVNAISGSSTPKPQTSGATSTAGHSQEQSSNGRSGSSGSTDTTGTSGSQDKSSDAQAPQLIAISFNPPQVHDGEETVLAVQAADDLSGIRSISGTIAAPSGAVQGFACQRELDSDRYTARIMVPKDAAEGVWRVNYLSLIDNASNASTLSGAQGAMPPTASFKVVSSRPDSQGPTLKSIWMEKPAIRAGEKDTIFIDADDDKSGVNLVSGVFISPAKLARIGFVCRPGSGVWQCDLATPECLDCGEWTLDQVQLQDKANNMTTVRADNPAVAGIRLSITGDRCDSTPPAIQTLVLDRNAVSNIEISVVTVTASASDDMCGVMSISGQATGPATPSGSPSIFFPFTPADPQTWTGRITVPRLAAKGTWRVTWIQVLDQGHNLKTYSRGDPVLATAVFNVQ